MTQTTLRDYFQSTEDAISSGRIEDAMTNCQRILTYFPEALEAQRLLGEVYLAQGYLEEAQQTFDWILVNDPENVIVYCDRALISERLSDIDTALDCYQQAYELSRANTQIRHEFNQLSAKAGQQDFMFSRAGLARLYMRGDLLTQAIQEWESVLALSPGRLDARTGLLEAYWREGLYEQAQQLATQILEEIPTCLKALLLLAHITAPSNLSRAQELLQRAEVLDPDLAMAYDLFGDLMASQPNDPFLALLKRDPIVFSDAADETPTMAPPSPENTGVEANGSLSPVGLSDPLYGWNNMESWSELDTQTVPEGDLPSPAHESPVFSTWSDNIQNVDAWANMNARTQIEPELETWQAPQDFAEDFDPATLQQQPWYQADQSSAPSAEAPHEWENVDSLSHAESTDVWKKEPQATENPAPPAWLDMLTKGERRQPSGAMAPLAPAASHAQASVEGTLPAQSPAPVELNFDMQTLSAEELKTVPATSEQTEEPAFFFSSEDNEVDMGWPEWLKSLGAESIKHAPQPEIAPLIPESRQVAIPTESWEDVIDETLSEEKPDTTTLEHLENDLHFQGFVPLQPGTLSTIAQKQEPTLSSALAQLANIAPPPPQPQTQPAQSTPSTSSTSRPAEAIPQPQAAPAQSTEMPASPVPVPEPEASAISLPEVQEPRPEPSTRAEAPQEPVFEPIASPAASVSQETPLVSSYRADALLENELETTMKRPAIRLQPMHHPSARTDSSYSTARGHAGERAASGRTPDANLSNKERLLKGYQYQLAGAYDDAMLEYRIIIRNAPELLGEVISNVRALLKLAPRYSTGFRVLGDAYMRQGEYLQAMEAYNKALTIAKKAKASH